MIYMIYILYISDISYIYDSRKRQEDLFGEKWNGKEIFVNRV